MDFDGGPIWLGTDIDGANPNARYRGMLDVVTIYERALADAEL